MAPPRKRRAAEPAVAREIEELAYFGDLNPGGAVIPSAATVELSLFADAVIEGVNGGNSRLLECAFTDTEINGGSLKRARLSEIWMRRVRLIDLDLAETTWHDVTILDSSIAALEAFGSRLHRVVLVGCKLNSLNLREAELTDVDFVDCLLQDVDLMGAKLRNVRFIRTTIARLNLERSALDNVDFSAAGDLELISDGGSLRGAIISGQQLVALAPAIAESLGITVRD